MTFIQCFFSPFCLGCHQPLRGGRQAFCFACTRFLLRTKPHRRRGEAQSLLPHEGAGKGFVAALRGLAPRRTAAWALVLLERQGVLGAWQTLGVEVVLSAPQNPRKETGGLALLAESIAQRIGAQFVPKAFRKKILRTQHGRSLVERMDTPCFIELARPSQWIKGKHVLLLDDVLTTGTTLDLCAYLVKKAGASRVSRFALARQVVPGLERKHEQAHQEGQEISPLLL